eukprot:3936949-Rhodomonas_salina.1
MRDESNEKLCRRECTGGSSAAADSGLGGAKEGGRPQTGALDAIPTLVPWSGGVWRLRGRGREGGERFWAGGCEGKRACGSAWARAASGPARVGAGRGERGAAARARRDERGAGPSSPRGRPEAADRTASVTAGQHACAHASLLPAQRFPRPLLCPSASSRGPTGHVRCEHTQLSLGARDQWPVLTESGGWWRGSAGFEPASAQGDARGWVKCEVTVEVGMRDGWEDGKMDGEVEVGGQAGRVREGAWH